jgi:hypothetical protein
VKICLTEVDDIVCVEIGIVDQGDEILATTLVTSGTYKKINKVQRGIEQNVARIHPNTQNIPNEPNEPNRIEYRLFGQRT